MSVRFLRQLAGALRRKPRSRRARYRRAFSLEALEARLPLTATVVAPLQDATFDDAQETIQFDLSESIQDPSLYGTVTRWETSLGSFYVDLYDSITPQTVRNFLAYVESGAYNDPTLGDTFFHRSVPGFIVQGGGFRWDGGDDNIIDTFAPVENEFDELRDHFGANTPINVRGTIAMAKLGGDPDSATSQWFFNLDDDNANNLDFQNGGFTTFGRVLGDGMSVLDAIAALNRYNKPGSLSGGAYTDVPLQNYTTGQTVTTENLARVTGIEVVSPMSGYSVVSNSNSDLVAATIVDGRLTLSHQAGQTGSATITVRGTDRAGGAVEDTFTITFAEDGGHAPQIAEEHFGESYQEADADQTVSFDLSQWFADADLAAGDSLTYSVSGAEGTGWLQAEVAGSTLNVTIAANGNGLKKLRVRATDQTGALVEQEFRVGVGAVNDAPTVATELPDSTFDEDVGTLTLDTAAAQMFDDVDIRTNNDSLTISVASNSNPQLFTTSVEGSAITFTSVPDAHGTATFTIRATDQAGEFVETTLTIALDAVNDAPAFTLGADDISLAGAARTVANWAKNIEAGPADESGQQVEFVISSIANSGIFSVPPTISDDGTLHYQLKPGASGTATINLRLRDDGGTDNAGVNQSASQSFTITALATNPWQNPNNPHDVDDDGRVTPFDLLALANELRHPFYGTSLGQLPLSPTRGALYFDIDGGMDNGQVSVSQNDITALANYLRAHPPANNPAQAAAPFVSPQDAPPPAAPSAPLASAAFDATMLMGLPLDADAPPPSTAPTTSDSPPPDAVPRDASPDAPAEQPPVWESSVVAADSPLDADPADDAREQAIDAVFAEGLW
jgi:cyclophilin family peptidyl-prolyl cis-trans isomerase